MCSLEFRLRDKVVPLLRVPAKHPNEEALARMDRLYTEIGSLNGTALIKAIGSLHLYSQPGHGAVDYFSDLLAALSDAEEIDESSPSETDSGSSD